MAMHLVQCLKQGLPLSALDSGSAPKSRKKPITADNKTPTPDGKSDASDHQPLAETAAEITSPRSPRRRSRMASLLGDIQQQIKRQSRGMMVRKSERDTSAAGGGSHEKQEHGEASSREEVFY